ncbi:nuclear transport factor 2 family protein [Sphingomonas sp. SRS2]|uniref:nuclear transport factor 2 family protein n=1 Tax=Sphingomonas sp. SRS2 TaxID=133190 RepID=UPI0006184603|nr:nuclear transport factor 2 family protein [Sphingomonas sp. SRS2]KKC23957.1 hypothetical protein WP12_21930 [Sphingomonas sp. SRS2]
MTQKSEDYVEIYNLLGKYSNVFDFREWDRLGELFTTDAILDPSSEGYPVITGLEAMKAIFPQNPPPNVHTNLNFVIEDYDGTHAKVHTRALTIDAERKVVPGYYEDDLIKTSDGWRIARRLVHQLLPPL